MGKAVTCAPGLHLFDKWGRPWRCITCGYEKPLEIGDAAWVHAVVESRLLYHPNETTPVRVLERVPCEDFVALVTGGTIRYEGRVEGGLSSSWLRDYDDGRYLQRTRSRELVCLRRGWLNKEIWALPEDLKRAWKGDRFPRCYRAPAEWDNKARAELREVMRDWPRDERGRWKKG